MLRRRHLMASVTWFLLATVLSAAAATPPHIPGVVHLEITVQGAEIQAELTGPAITLLGFEQAPRTADQRATLQLARENLQAGDAMLRFDTRADCRLTGTRLETALPAADIRAHYRFHCDHPSELGSAALGLFAGFPAVVRVFVRYRIPAGRGSAELTPAEPVANLVPL